MIFKIIYYIYLNIYFRIMIGWIEKNKLRLITEIIYSLLFSL